MNNEVELIGYYGSDETHALSAWTSTSRDLTDDKRGRMGGLLNMLAEAGHHTPFEKSSIHFLVTTDIASHIPLLQDSRLSDCRTFRQVVEPFSRPCSCSHLPVSH